jgi:D-alanyl-D-alanine carboxypeptidase
LARLSATFKSSLFVLVTGMTLNGGVENALAQSPTLVVDASNGTVISAEDATHPWNPASTTKMMTAYVALRAVQSGLLTIETPLIASANAARQKPSKLGIRTGQEITLDNALKVLMVKSANDIAIVVAEAIGGSVPGFSAMMNAEARRLGMNESRFSNPHGFHAEGHQTSARDLALLAMAMLRDFPEYREYWGIGAVQSGNRIMYNTNGLIGRYPGATGFKTGFVCSSGFNLVAMANRGGRTLITVVLGAGSGGERVVRSAQLLDQGFASWGGNGYTLASLPASGYRSAPNMRSQICSGRRGVVLADDSDYGGAILADSHSGDSMAAGSPMAFFALQNTASSTRSVRSSGGRPILGPRSGISPVAIYFGRAPGSTAVALGPGGARRTQPATASTPVEPTARTAPGAIPGLPAAASALASTNRNAIPGLESPASQATIRPGQTRIAPQRPRPLPAEDDKQPDAGGRASGAPLQLPGVVTTTQKAETAKAGTAKAGAISGQKNAARLDPKTIPKASSGSSQKDKKLTGSGTSATKLPAKKASSKKSAEDE